MSKLWMVDLDETLLWDEYTYTVAFRKFEQFLIERVLKRRAPYVGALARLTEDMSASMIHTINPHTGRSYGHTMERFPDALVVTYKMLCDDKVNRWAEYDEKVARRIFAIGMSAYDPAWYRDLGLVPGAEETLDFLKAKGDLLVLVTKGDPRVQWPKIKALELSRWFEEFVVVEDGSKEDSFSFFTNEERRREFSISQVNVVGNSLEADIKTALKAGSDYAFHIPLTAWKGDVPQEDIPQTERLIVLREIREIIDIYDELI